MHRAADSCQDIRPAATGEVSPLLRGIFMAFGVASATLYAAGLAFSAESLARTGAALLNVEEDRYRLLARNMSDVISVIAATARCSSSRPPGNDAGNAGRAAARPWPVRPRHVADRPPISPRFRKPRAAAMRAASNSASGAMCRAAASEARIIRSIFSGSRLPLPAARTAIATATRPSRRGDARRHRPQSAGTGARFGAHAAEQADAAKTRFLATMSHELRTPLNAIIGFSEMIVQEEALMLNAARRREYAQLINDSGQHLLSVGQRHSRHVQDGVRQFRDRAGAVRAARRLGSIAASLLALKARENGIDLVTRMPADLPVMTGDPRAFKQVVLNLFPTPSSSPSAAAP